MGNYKKEWDIFEANPDYYGNISAIYWKGYYYLEGVYIIKNKPKTMELFKKSSRCWQCPLLNYDMLFISLKKIRLY